MKRFLALVVLAGVLVAATGAAWAAGRFSDGEHGLPWPYPLVPGPVVNPVLTKYDVTDCPAGLVADPFLIHKDGIWYMFFEIYAWPGVIGLATSLDGLDWTYDRVVLEEDHHISYPCVFSYDDGTGEQYYMVVESGATQTVPLYKSTSFPYQWSQVATLASGREFADPTIFRWNGTWWMFVSRANSDVCYLYYSDTLTGGWVEHPQSPIAVGRGVSRPAGRVFVDGACILRKAQKCDVHYGEAVRVFQVDQLTRVAYTEHEIPDSPIVHASGQGWNDDGMHTCDEFWTGTSWLAAVDGLGPLNWSIGIYAHYHDPAATGPPPVLPCRLRTYPNPLPTGQAVHLVLDGGEAGRRVQFEFTDAAGRSVGRNSFGGWSAPGDGRGGPLSYSWITKDVAGRPLAPGVYFVKVTAGWPGQPPQAKIVVTR